MTPTLLGAALVVEARKAASARVVTGTTILLIVGVAVLGGASTTAAASGNEQLLAKLGPLAAQGGWPSLLSTVSQVTAAGGLLAFGVALSWLVGREFADGTVTGLFALPVSRPTIALAKLIVYLLWSVVVATLLVLLVAGLGFAVATGAFDGAASTALLRLWALTVLTALLAVPAGWAATIGRGLLPGIATTIAILAATQVMVVAGTGGWIPLAAPALWAIVPGSVSGAQMSLVPLVPLTFGLLTLSAWRRLQLDR
ncbi:ABC transporter permease [Plantactinospora soyae]|uniref:ABC-2 type transport system permease protein n=1 Tax=Plantactinospora soyae TaxID=1544732 RepID=A0A927MEJ1_9ACTN|nr:ABC transporter permease [Plantactinospora soyae]MBE1489655.1 ABC-2 type transport system permease protein [Plantactinospora soyae]